jgi:predicted transcriptional regulator of viral defense system
MPTSVAPRLFDLASDQAGVFTLSQAAAAKIAKRTLARALERGDVERLSRGIYVLRNYPTTPDAELWAAVLFPTVDREGAELGVLSHDTALVHHLPDSDVAPAKIHITATFLTPPRRATPATLVVHRGHVAENEREFTNAGVPVTTPFRTIGDCFRTGRHMPEALTLYERAVRDHRITGDEAAKLQEIAVVEGREPITWGQLIGEEGEAPTLVRHLRVCASH